MLAGKFCKNSACFTFGKISDHTMGFAASGSVLGYLFGFPTVPIRWESAREERASEVLSVAIKTPPKARTAVGRMEGEEPFIICDPGSELDYCRKKSGK